MKRLSLSLQIAIARNLSQLLRSGIPLSESLGLISSHYASQSLQARFEAVKRDAESGMSFAASLQRNPGLFDTATASLIRIAEHAGKLEPTLEHIAHHLAKRRSMRKKLIGASIYPLAILASTLGLCIFLVAYIFPKLQPMFASMKSTLPLSTRSLIYASDILRTYGIYLAILLAFCVAFCAYALRKSPRLTRMRDDLLLRMPVIRNIIITTHVISFSRNLGIMLAAGLPLAQAIAANQGSAHNALYAECYQEAVRRIESGSPLSSHLKAYQRLFPLPYIHGISIAERTRTLPETLAAFAERYEEEMDNHIKSLTGLIEPCLMIGMGIAISFVSFSIISPIYSLTQAIQR